jgi:F-type H+-transporting ATPase subunit gamma
MQNAEKNIDESLEDMNLQYQQQRQESITDELIDVISGAEAMK